MRRLALTVLAVLSALVIHAQNQVTGIVLDEQNLPVIAATVMIDGTNTGTLTDESGRYSISAKPGDRLSIICMGYKTVNVTVGANAVYDVTLVPDDLFLEEVVVVGYDVQKKVNLTGSVSAVDSDKLYSRPAVSTSSALQGMATGVTITNQSGNPGASGTSIRIRGIGSFGGSDCSPLILVDGVQGSLDDIDPTQIEQISILKDAASASIYGSRAANGVILVTTKRGSSKDVFSVTYRGYVGWSKPTALPKLVNAVEYMTLSREASLNDGNSTPYTPEYINNYMANHKLDPDTYPITKWQEEVLNGSGFLHNHTVTMNASTAKMKDVASFSFLDQKGIIQRQNYQRYNFRNNLNIDPAKWVGIRFDSYISYGVRHAVPQAASLFNMMNTRDPLILTRWSSGDYAPMTGGSVNILPVTKGAGGNKVVDNITIVQTAALTLKPVKGLVIEGKVTPRFVMNHTHTFTDKIEYYADQYGTKSPVTSILHNTLSESQNRALYMTWQATVSYGRTFGDHTFKVLAGVSRETMSRKSFAASRQDLAYTQYEVLNVGADDEYKDNSGSASQWALQSYFGRINYNYKERYLFEANLRYDGSSRFAKGHKWGLFPSFSAAWRLSEESFMKPASKILTEMKLRVSYGTLGNQNISSSNYPFTEIMSFTSFSMADLLYPIVRNSSLANPAITWETTSMVDAGVDLSLWNKLSLTADFYSKRTNGILMQLNIPLSTGLGAPYQNAGVVSNIGWELAVGYHDTFGDFSVGVDANISDVYNKIVDMHGQIMTASSSLIRNQEGYSINSIYGLHCIGMARTQAEADWVNMNIPQFGKDINAGDLVYADTNKDGKVNNDDKTIIGCAIPRYTYGLTLNFGWKGIYLSAFFQGVGKADGYLNSYYVLPCINGGTFRKEHLDRWNSENPNGRFPRMSYSSEHNRYVSDFWMGDASYLRLKNLQIGYSFPKQLIKKARMRGLDIFATAENLFTITKFYQGYDPEVCYNADASSGVSLGGVADNYPQVKTFTFGVEIKF